MNLKSAYSALNQFLLEESPSVSSLALYKKLASIKEALAGSSAKEVEGRNLWDILEKIFEKSGVVFGRGLQSLIASVYVEALSIAPSFLLRSTFQAITGVAGGKASSSARECAVYVLGVIAIECGEGLGSVVCETITCLSKIIRSYDLAVRTLPSDLTLRAAVYTSLAHMVRSGSDHAKKLHGDLVKLAGKWIVSDKCADVRLAISQLLMEVAIASDGFTSVSMEKVTDMASKGLADECSIVANAFVRVVAKCFSLKVIAHRENEEANRADIARGGAGEQPSDKKTDDKQTSYTAKLKEAVSMKRKIVETYDMRALLKYQLGQMTATPEGPLKNAHALIIHHMVVNILHLLDKSELEWMLAHLVGSLRSPSPEGTTRKGAIFSRSLMSYIFRTGIFANLPEIKQLECVSILVTLVCKISTANDAMVDAQLIFILGELGHMIHLLGESASSLVERVEGLAITQLRSTNFDVRTNAVHLLLALATVAPVIGAGYFRDALGFAKVQARQLMEQTGTDDAVNSNNRRMSSKITEKVQRMCLLHGQILLVSVFMRHIMELPTGLSTDLIVEALEFGLSLLAFDFQHTHPTLLPIACSVMRAGSLIVSSVLSIGFDTTKARVPSILSTVKFLLTLIENPRQSSEAMAELMAIESTLIIISALLWFCPESLSLSENCLNVVVESLEKIYTTTKQNYQAKFKDRYRFKVIRAMIFELFSCLPAGSFPNTATALYADAVRVFRDCVAMGYETSRLTSFASHDHEMLRPTAISKIASNFSQCPPSFEMLMFDIELYGSCLDEKESESRLAAFPRRVMLAGSTFLGASPDIVAETHIPTPPVTLLDSRTIDAAIACISSLFPFQETQYKLKGVEVCVKLMAAHQMAHSSSMSMFAMDEDKRRREKREYLLVLNVTTMFASILRSFPSIMIMEEDAWVAPVMSHLVNVLTHPHYEIRSCAATAITSYAMKAAHTGLVNDVVSRMTSDIQAALVSDLKASAQSSSTSFTPSSYTSSTDHSELNKLAGHVLTLTSFGNYGQMEAQLHLNITTSLIACAKRVVCSLEFKAFACYALASALQQSNVGSAVKERTEMASLVNEVCGIIESQLSHASRAYDSATATDLLMKNLQRLTNACFSVLSQVSEVASDETISRLTTSWLVISRLSGTEDVICESLTFVKTLLAYQEPLKSPYVSMAKVRAIDFIKSTLKQHNQHGPKTLSVAASCIRAIAYSNMDALVDAGIDLQAFSVANWACFTNVSTIASPLLCIHIPENICDRLDSAQTSKDWMALIKFLANCQVARAPETAVVRWILIGQAIFGGSTTKVYDKMITEDLEAGAQSDDENDRKESPEEGTTDIYEFLEKVRDDISAVAAMTTCLKVKMLAVQCGIKALAYCTDNINKMDSAHFDLEDAMAKLTIALKNRDQIKHVQLFTVLFLEDALKFACSSTSFTVDDKQMPAMQASGVKFLQQIVEIFCRPDIHPSTRDIVRQVISQVVSALRTCLSSRWQASLLLKAGDIACILITGEYIRDLLVVKRLIRSIISACLPVDRRPSSRPQSSEDVADIISLECNVAAARTIARVYLLARSPYEHSLGTDLIDFLADVIPSDDLQCLKGVWRDLAIDGARVNQGSRCWPVLSTVTDPRRGGASYPPIKEFGKIRNIISFSLPVITRACSEKQILEADTSVQFFAVAQCLLASLDINDYSSGTVQDMCNVLATFVNIASVPEARCRIPFSEWAIVARFFIFNILCDQSSGFPLSIFPMVVKSLIDLLEHMASMDGDGAEPLLLSLGMWLTDALCGDLSSSFFGSGHIGDDSAEGEVLEVFGQSLFDRVVRTTMKPETGHVLYSTHAQKLLRLLLSISSSWGTRGSVGLALALSVLYVDCGSSVEIKADAAIAVAVLLKSDPLSGAMLLEFLLKISEGRSTTALTTPSCAEIILLIWSSLPNGGCQTSKSALADALTAAPILLASASTRIIQTGIRQGKILSSALFSRAIVMISDEALADEAGVLLVLCQLLVAVFTVTTVQDRPAYLRVFVPAVSVALRNVVSADSEFTLYSGRVMTQLATNEATTIRECIPQLSDDLRASMQSSMKMAMQQLNQTSAAQNQPKAPKKLDLKRFKK